ncbi:muscle M-line assembly protein unc-89-like [Ischnura elegans]|uniref:muscle M-line assembly protein unc-89-like n=1 Tax=Ischnura elegans TaxID=197161 RepID=UPI001ED869D8|nr:muscle M-line assembly protein unc-89-like [Ischnura elegans]
MGPRTLAQQKESFPPNLLRRAVSRRFRSAAPRRSPGSRRLHPAARPSSRAQIEGSRGRRRGGGGGARNEDGAEEALKKRGGALKAQGQGEGGGGRSPTGGSRPGLDSDAAGDRPGAGGQAPGAVTTPGAGGSSGGTATRMSGEAGGGGDQGGTTPSKSKPAVVKANGSAPAVPWGDPGGPSLSETRPGDPKVLAMEEAKGQTKPEQRQKTPEAETKGGAKKMAERGDAQEKAKEGGQGKKTEVSTAVGPNASAVKKSPVDTSSRTSTVSTPVVTSTKAKDADVKTGASQKSRETTKERSPTSDKTLSSKSQPASSLADGKAKNGGKKDDASDAQMKVLDTSKRKSPTGEKKAPVKAETSHRPLDRKAKEPEKTSAASSSTNQPTIATKKKSPTSERPGSKATAVDSGGKAKDDKGTIQATSTQKVEPKSIKEKSPNGGRSVSSKPESITGSKSSAVAGSVAVNAQETSKRRSPTDEKSIPSPKVDTITGAAGLKTKEPATKATVTPSVEKSPDHAIVKSKVLEKPMISKSNADTGDQSSKKTEGLSGVSISASTHGIQDASKKKMSPEKGKKTISKKSVEDPKDLSQGDIVSGTHGPSKESEEGPTRSLQGVDVASKSESSKLASKKDNEVSKSPSQVSSAEKKVEAKSHAEKISSPNSSSENEKVEKLKDKAHGENVGEIKPVLSTQPAKPTSLPLSDSKSEKSSSEKKLGGPASGKASSSKSDVALPKTKQAKPAVSGVQEVKKDLESAGIPKKEKSPSPESEKHSPVATSPIGPTIGGTFNQREDYSKTTPTDLKKAEPKAVPKEISEGKSPKIVDTRTNDTKFLGERNGGQKPQNGVDRQEGKAKTHGEVAREKSINGKKAATFSADPKKGKSGEGKEEGRSSVQRGNGGQAGTPPSSSVRMEGLPSPTTSVTPNGSSSRTPTEHKTIVQKLQEARQEAILVRAGDRKDLRQQYSKSEMVLPAVLQTTLPVASGSEAGGDKQHP